MERTETPICMPGPFCRWTDGANSSSVEPRRLRNLSRNGCSTPEQAQIIPRCLTKERGGNSGEKFAANASCTFECGRVLLTKNVCEELNLYNGASGTVLDGPSASTVDPRETRQSAETRQSHA